LVCSAPSADATVENHLLHIGGTRVAAEDGATFGLTKYRELQHAIRGGGIRSPLAEPVSGAGGG
ncbi:MAG: hypothetical protein ABI990_06845, partial [Actinomycetota bacterium]